MVRNYSMPKPRDVMGGPQQRFIVKELYFGAMSLQRYGPSNCVWLRLQIKQNQLSILKRKLFAASLEQKFKHTSAYLANQPTTKQQRLTYALKNVRFEHLL